MDVVVGRLGRAHGIRGELTVEVRTDEPEARLAPGCVLRTDPADRGPVTVRSAHWHSGRLLLGLEGVADRAAAEALRDTLLVVDTADLPPVDEPDTWRDHDLVGLGVQDGAGTPLGVVEDVVHHAQDLLVLRLSDGREALVPFVRALVPVVDVAGGRVVVTAPPGLLDDGPGDTDAPVAR